MNQTTKEKIDELKIKIHATEFELRNYNEELNRLLVGFLQEEQERVKREDRRRR